MAHYALINSNNIVVDVITGIDENIIQSDENGLVVGGSTQAWEEFYQTRPWYKDLYCKRTSYNNKIRKNYAGIGYKYDKDLDAFIPPKPFNSWLFDEDTCRWLPPIPQPPGNIWRWDEETLSWYEYPT